ncbi:hypothetical protein AB0D97_06785 [Streptomyces roseus]|uniref:hypothetical protein n=1 Tax=Streptomyces roseus TaxID=66430 RepID=UPI0033C63CC1
MVDHVRDASRPDFLSKPSLRGERVLLRPVAVDDVPALMPMFLDAEFVAEGVLRDALLWQGERVGAAVMSILAPEWFQHGGRPETAGHASV